MIKMTQDERARLTRLLGSVMDDETVVPWTLGEEQVLAFLLELDRRMTADGVTQADLGRALGVQRSQVRRWISAEGRLKADTMFALARSVGCQLTQRWEPIVAEQRPVGGYASAGESVASASCDVQQIKVTVRVAA